MLCSVYDLFFRNKQNGDQRVRIGKTAVLNAERCKTDLVCLRQPLP